MKDPGDERDERHAEQEQHARLTERDLRAEEQEALPEGVAREAPREHRADDDAVRAEVDTMIFCKEVPYARIEIAVLGNDAGIIGAAMLGK